MNKFFIVNGKVNNSIPEDKMDSFSVMVAKYSEYHVVRAIEDIILAKNEKGSQYSFFIENVEEIECGHFTRL